jgi:hypothetical protein
LRLQPFSFDVPVRLSPLTFVSGSCLLVSLHIRSLLGAHVDSDDRLFRIVFTIRASLIVPPVSALLVPELHRFRLTPDPLKQDSFGAGSSPHLPRLMTLRSGAAILGLSVPGASVSL